MMIAPMRFSDIVRAASAIVRCGDSVMISRPFVFRMWATVMAIPPATSLRLWRLGNAGLAPRGLQPRPAMMCPRGISRKGFDASPFASARPDGIEQWKEDQPGNKSADMSLPSDRLVFACQRQRPHAGQDINREPDDEKHHDAPVAQRLAEAVGRHAESGASADAEQAERRARLKHEADSGRHMARQGRQAPMTGIISPQWKAR